MRPKDCDTLTASRLRELMSYDKETGEFRWKVRKSGNAPAGAIAGYRTKFGYIQLGVEKKRHQAHRLAWLYVYGRWPADQIDHINGIRNDNRIDNLREATSAENHQNTCLRKDNKSGHQGVVWHSRSKRWRAQIVVDGKNMYIGAFKSIDDAIAARTKAKAKFHRFQPKDRLSDKRTTKCIERSQ